MPTFVESEVGEALRETMRISAEQRQKIVSDLREWARLRSKVPDTDERLWGLLRAIPLLVGQLELHIDARGVSVAPVNGRLVSVALFLSRGASWLRGGDWESVVLACVVRKN